MFSTKSLLCAAPFFLSALPALGQTLAFPGALGYGAYASGGRNGTVYHVTNLNDSGAGSFRDAVSSSGRTIVFDVGGHIKLLSAVSCKGNLTIAGQTAPGGICFDAGEISFAARANIICRYLRIRPGSDTASTGDDCISFYQSTNVILDHVSMAFGPWNNIDAVTANNITVQHSIDANPIGQQFGAHTENVGAFYSWQYNIFANSHNRNPLAKINDTFINNLDYNCSAGYTTHTSTRFKHDIVNNYFVSGPAYGGSGDFPWYQVDNNQSIYYSGNLIDNNYNGTLDGTVTTPYWYQGGSGGTVLSSPWSSWTTVIPTLPTAAAWRYDVSTSGAFPRDDVDTLLINQVKTIGSGTTGTGAGTTGPNTGLYTSQSQTGLANNGYGSITAGVAAQDTDNDGMPDYWELATGTDPNTANPLTNSISGYTPLENYLNYLAGPHGITQTNTAVDINLTQFTTGFSASATFSLTNATNGTISLLSATNAHFVPTANFTGLAGFTFIITDSGFSLNVPVTVCVTPLVPPASATAFGGALMYAVTNAISVVPPNNLTWRGDGAVNAWNTTTSNWLNGANAALFKNGDVVTFDDTGSASPNVVVASGIIPGAVLFNNTQNYTLGGSGSLSGSGTFTKSGSGTVTVGTTNSGFTGSINQNGGSLLIVSGATLGSGSIALSGGSIFGVLGGGAGSAISGPISVALNDSVTLYSGQLATTFGGALSCPDTTSTLNLSNSVSLSGTSSSQFSGFYGTINIPSGTTLRFSANSSGNSFGSLNPNFIINGTLQPRNAGNSITLGALNGAGQLTGPQTASTGTGNTVYTVGGKNLDAVFNGSVISNASSAGSAICLNKVGTGTQTLNGNNMFTGTNGILAGTLVMNGSNVSALVTVFTNATLSGTGVVSGIVRVNPGGILSPGGKTPGTFSIYGNLTNNGPVLNFDLSPTPTVSNDLLNVYGTLNLTGTQQFNFNLTGGALGAGTYSLIEGATNSVQTSLVLTSSLPANTRQALALVAAPAGNNPAYVRLQVSGSASALLWQGNNGNNWDTSTVNWLNGASADQYYNLDTVTFDDTAATGNINLAELVQPGSLLVNNSSLAYTFSGSGALSGSSALRKSGPGSLSIATINNSYFGSIVVSGGSLGVASGANLGSGPVSLGGGTTLALPGSGNAVGLGNALAIPAAQTAALTSGILSSTLSGNLIAGNPGSTLNLAGAGVSLGATTSAQLDGFPGTIDIPPGTTVRFSANSSGNTFGSFTPTFIIDGTLQPRNAGNTIQLGAFSGSGTLAGAQAASGTGDTAYIVGGNNTDANFSGNISSNTAVAGQVILNKIGSGRLTLNGASTYAGGTTVSAGTLRVLNTTGSGTGSGDLEVFSGATLSGTGILASAVTIDNGGILAAGNPTGTLTISNYLTLNDSSLLPFTLGGTSSSVKVSGDLALTGQLMITNGSGFGPGFYPLFTYGGALNLGHLVLASLPSGFNYSYSLDTNTTGVVTLIVSLPTPPSFGNLSLTGGNLSLSGSNGTPGANYYLLQSSNLINWTFIATNQFDTNGTFNVNLTVPVNPPQNFYRLQL